MYVNRRWINIDTLREIAIRYNVDCRLARQGGPKGTEHTHILGPFGIVYENRPWVCMRLYETSESGLTIAEQFDRFREGCEMGMRYSKYDVHVMYWHYHDIAPTLIAFELIGARERGSLFPSTPQAMRTQFRIMLETWGRISKSFS